MSTLHRWVRETGTNLAMIGTMFLVSVFPILSAAPVAQAIAPTPQWSLVNGPIGITFTCVTGCGGDWAHTMTVTSENTITGDFSGTGNYIADPSYTWDITGNTVDSSINYHLLYTGTLAGYTLDAVGSIDENGNLSGTATDAWSRTFTWQSVSGSAVEIVGNGVKPAECTATYTHLIQGTNGNDTIYGTSGNDLIFGYAGNDKIYSGSGNDCIVGGTGNDKIDGGSGNDVIFGNAGDDNLIGNSGNDSVYGNSGNDTLSGGAGNDYLDGGTGVDTANGNTGVNACSAETQINC